MKELLKTLKADLRKVESLPDRSAEMQIEQADLVAEIAMLSKAVSGGDVECLSKLGIARERLAQLPAKYKALQEKDNEAVKALDNDVVELYPAFGEEYSRQRSLIGEEVETFLTKFGLQPHFIGEVARQVANEAAIVTKFDNLRTVFSGLRIGGQRIHKDLAVSRAKYALQQLADYLK